MACGAGELVEEQSDLTGLVWTVSALYLSGQAIVRRGSEYHHFDPLGTAGVITDGSGNVLSNNLYDFFGVQRYSTGSAVTQWRWEDQYTGEDGLLAVAGGSGFVIPGRATPLWVPPPPAAPPGSGPTPTPPGLGPTPPPRPRENCSAERAVCMVIAAVTAAACITAVTAALGVCMGAANALPFPLNGVAGRACWVAARRGYIFCGGLFVGMVAA